MTSVNPVRLQQLTLQLFGRSAPRALAAAVKSCDWSAKATQCSLVDAPRTPQQWTDLCCGTLRRIRGSALYTAETFEAMVNKLDDDIWREEMAFDNRFVERLFLTLLQVCLICILDASVWAFVKAHWFAVVVVGLSLSLVHSGWKLGVMKWRRSTNEWAAYGVAWRRLYNFGTSHRAAWKRAVEEDEQEVIAAVAALEVAYKLLLACKVKTDDSVFLHVDMRLDKEWRDKDHAEDVF